MALDPDTPLLDGRFVIERALDENPVPFTTTYRGRDTENEVAAVTIVEYFPRALAGRSADGSVAPREGQAETFRQGMKYFRKEAKVLREAAHPNLTRELEDFEEGGTAYRVSARPGGASLATALEKKGGRISERAALTVMQPVLKALHALHRQGLLHGGVSPEAVYLTESREVLLGGFRGAQMQLARKTGALDQVTIPGISPAEQYAPDGRWGPWTDVYAAAATFYRAVAGRPLPEAHAGSLAEETVAEHLRRADTLSKAVRRVLERALAPRPRGRFQSAQAFAEALADPAKRPGERDDDEPSRQPASADAPASPDSQTEAWGPASMAAAAAEAIQEDRERASRGAEQAKEPDAPPEPGRVEEADPDDGEAPGAEEQGREGRGRRRPATLAAAALLVVLLGGAALMFTGVLDSTAGSANRDADVDGPARYERLRAEGDSLLEQADYRAARQRYQRAQQARPRTETGGYVDKRLREIERRQAARQKKRYEQAIRQGDSLQAQAQQQAGEGNDRAAGELYAQASEAYLAALQHRPNDSLALARTRQASARSASSGVDEKEGNASDENPLCSICGQRHEPGFHDRAAQMYRSQAQEAFQDENYTEARRQYQSLLDHKPDDAAARQKIEEIDALISEADRQEQFQRYRRRGNTFFQKGNLTEARREYQLALDVQPGDSTVTRRLQTIEERLARRQKQQEQYQRHRDEGDTFFENEEMKKAARSYEKALEYRPEDSYVQERLKEARRLAAAAEKKTRRQNDDRTEKDVYEHPDEQPKIVGGLKALVQEVSYPNRAQREGAEGKVFLRVTVGTNGAAERVEVIRSSIEFGAPEESVEAARNAEYEPGRVDGKPVRAYKTVMIPFQLR
jgi:TonB family protein